MVIVKVAVADTKKKTWKSAKMLGLHAKAATDHIFW